MSRFIELHLNDSDSTPVIVNIDKMLQFKKNVVPLQPSLMNKTDMLMKR